MEPMGSHELRKQQAGKIRSRTTGSTGCFRLPALPMVMSTVVLSTILTLAMMLMTTMFMKMSNVTTLMMMTMMLFRMPENLRQSETLNFRSPTLAKSERINLRCRPWGYLVLAGPRSHSLSLSLSVDMYYKYVCMCILHISGWGSASGAFNTISG